MKYILAMMAMAALCFGAWGQGKTPSPALLVLSKEESFLAIVDPVTLKVVGKIDTGAYPHEVAASEDGKIAIVTNYGAHADGTTLSVIDLDAQKEIRRVELGELKGPHGVEFDGKGAWFTAEGAKAIARYWPESNKITGVLQTDQERTHMVITAGHGSKVVTTNVNSNTVSWFGLDAIGDPKATNVAVGKGPEGMDASPDGREIWVANSGDGSVSILEEGTMKVVATLDVKTKHSNRLKFTPDGKLVLISDLGSGDLVVVDAASRKEVKRLNLGKNAEGILVQPDGARAFVAVSGDDKVAVVDLKKLEVTAKFAVGKDPDGMAWRK